MSAQHVLIVEDSLVYRRLLARMLAQWGYTVSEAENGVAALDILANQPVSLVISDWKMPEMDGLSLCREIRSRQFGHYVYVILLTAREAPDDLTLGFDAGADDSSLHKHLLDHVKVSATVCIFSNPEKRATHRVIEVWVERSMLNRSQRVLTHNISCMTERIKR